MADLGRTAASRLIRIDESHPHARLPRLVTLAAKHVGRAAAVRPPLLGHSSGPTSIQRGSPQRRAAVQRRGYWRASAAECFRTRRGMSPMRCVVERRLAAGWRLLRRASPHEYVTGAASRLGFAHASCFAGLNRQAFGELPSQTPRRGRYRLPLASPYTPAGTGRPGRADARAPRARRPTSHAAPPRVRAFSWRITGPDRSGCRRQHSPRGPRAFGFRIAICSAAREHAPLP